jgi:hypothetical protein
LYKVVQDRGLKAKERGLDLNMQHGGHANYYAHNVMKVTRLVIMALYHYVCISQFIQVKRL